MGPTPHATSTAALAGLSGWGTGHSGGGAMENTCASLSSCRRGVVGTCTMTEQAEVETMAKPNTHKARFRRFMATQYSRRSWSGLVDESWMPAGIALGELLPAFGQ